MQTAAAAAAQLARRAVPQLIQRAAGWAGRAGHVAAAAAAHATAVFIHSSHLTYDIYYPIFGLMRYLISHSTFILYSSRKKKGPCLYT